MGTNNQIATSQRRHRRRYRWLRAQDPQRSHEKRIDCQNSRAFPEGIRLMVFRLWMGQSSNRMGSFGFPQQYWAHRDGYEWCKREKRRWYFEKRRRVGILEVPEGGTVLAASFTWRDQYIFSLSETYVSDVIACLGRRSWIGIYDLWFVRVRW